jgi:hypothetical protein
MSGATVSAPPQSPTDHIAVLRSRAGIFAERPASWNRLVRLGGVGALLLLGFCFLWAGLRVARSQPDPSQIYLIGLKSYLTRTQPYPGTDVYPQVPGLPSIATEV